MNQDCLADKEVLAQSLDQNSNSLIRVGDTMIGNRERFEDDAMRAAVIRFLGEIKFFDLFEGERRDHNVNAFLTKTTNLAFQQISTLGSS